MPIGVEFSNLKLSIFQKFCVTTWLIAIWLFPKIFFNWNFYSQCLEREHLSYKMTILEVWFNECIFVCFGLLFVSLFCLFIYFLDLKLTILSSSAVNLQSSWCKPFKYSNCSPVPYLTVNIKGICMEEAHFAHLKRIMYDVPLHPSYHMISGHFTVSVHVLVINIPISM